MTRGHYAFLFAVSAAYLSFGVYHWMTTNGGEGDPIALVLTVVGMVGVLGMLAEAIEVWVKSRTARPTDGGVQVGPLPVWSDDQEMDWGEDLDTPTYQRRQLMAARRQRDSTPPVESRKREIIRRLVAARRHRR